MQNLVFNIIFFILVFLIVFVFCYFFAGRIKPKKIKGKKKGKSTYKMMNEGKLMIMRYHLDEKKIELKKLNIYICLCNALIISLTSTIISNIPLNMFYQLMCGFVLVFLLIYAVFELLGRYLNKKWGKDYE